MFLDFREGFKFIDLKSKPVVVHHCDSGGETKKIKKLFHEFSCEENFQISSHHQKMFHEYHKSKLLYLVLLIH
jgi:hypothetical protein